MTSPANYHEAGPDAQGDITDIDSIIEINGREIVTTVETCRDLYRGVQCEEQPSPSSASSSRVRDTPGNEHRGSAGILEYPAKCVNGRGSDLLSVRSPGVVTNLRDRVTVRLTTTRRCLSGRGKR